MIRLATVGTSAITASFLTSCMASGRYTLAAVYSCDAARGAAFGQRFGGARVFTDLPALLQSGCADAVYIASPNALHAGQSQMALEAGLHVLCEKPIVCRAEEYRRLKTLADRQGRIYLEALMARHVPHRPAVKAAVEELGRITLARIDFCQRSSRYDRFMQGEPVNIFDMRLRAGTLMDLGVYCVYAAVDLFGMPQAVTARKSELYNGADGSGCALLEYPGFTAVLTYGKTGQSALGSEIIGDRGTLTVASVSQYAGVTLHRDGGTRQIVGTPDRVEIMRGEAERFADMIECPAENAADYRDASRLCADVHTVMDCIRESAGLKYLK